MKMHEVLYKGVLVCISTKAGCEKYVERAIRRGEAADRFQIREN